MKMNNRLILMMGVPGCGKSYFAAKLAQWIPNTEIISRDEIRFKMLQSNDEYFKHEKQVFQAFILAINESLAAGHNVIIDATHINRQSRSKLLREINRDYYNRCDIFYMRTPIGRCIAQNNLREGRAKVPEKVIKDFWNRKKTPILDEGFDNIYYVFDCERISLAQGKDEAI